MSRQNSNKIVPIVVQPNNGDTKSLKSDLKVSPVGYDKNGSSRLDVLEPLKHIALFRDSKAEGGYCSSVYKYSLICNDSILLRATTEQTKCCQCKNPTIVVQDWKEKNILEINIKSPNCSCTTIVDISCPPENLCIGSIKEMYSCCSSDNFSLESNMNGLKIIVEEEIRCCQHPVYSFRLGNRDLLAVIKIHERSIVLEILGSMDTAMKGILIGFLFMLATNAGGTDGSEEDKDKEYIS